MNSVKGSIDIDVEDQTGQGEQVRGFRPRGHHTNGHAGAFPPSRLSHLVTRDLHLSDSASTTRTRASQLLRSCSCTPAATMEYLNARLDSFALKSKRIKASSSKTASPLKWPHSPSFKATPETLAEAGFYYNPEPDSPDNVTCFMCRKTLGGWEPDDDPFTIHYDKCRNTCAWAVVRCQSAGDLRYVSSAIVSTHHMLTTLTAMIYPTQRVIRPIKRWKRRVSTLLQRFDGRMTQQRITVRIPKQ